MVAMSQHRSKLSYLPLIAVFRSGHRFCQLAATIIKYYSLSFLQDKLTYTEGTKHEGWPSYTTNHSLNNSSSPMRKELSILEKEPWSHWTSSLFSIRHYHNTCCASAAQNCRLGGCYAFSSWASPPPPPSASSAPGHTLQKTDV